MNLNNLIAVTLYTGSFNICFSYFQQINNDLLSKIVAYDPTAGQELIPPEKIERYLKNVPHGEVAKHSSVPAQHMYNWVFVCLSLIEHTLKMRENNSDLLPSAENTEIIEREKSEAPEEQKTEQEATN